MVALKFSLYIDNVKISRYSVQKKYVFLVVGTLVFSLVVGITVPDISSKAIANLEYDNIIHLSPVFINDTVYARTTILDCIPSTKNKQHGIVYVETFGYNQHKQDVIRFRRKILIKKRPV
jgi:acyl dehydratase